MAFLAFLKQFSTRLFWLAALGVAAWFAFAMFNLSITKAYHPMAFLGSIGAIWFWGFAAFAGMIATARILCYARLEQRRDALDLGAAAVLLLTALLHNLSIGMDSGHKETVWINNLRHEIPWQYAPRTWQKEAFLVKVGTDQLLARYPAREMKYFTLSKSALPEAETAPLLKEPCAFDEGDVTCQTIHNGIRYKIHGRTADVPQDVARLLEPARKLLDGFIVQPAS